MIRYFCDHCGKEIRGNEINELDVEDCFYDFEQGKSIGYGAQLCPDCIDERNRKHIQLDLDFLHLSGEEKC